MLEVDGSCNRNTYRELLGAGAQVLVMGSSGLFRPDMPLEQAREKCPDLSAALHSPSTYKGANDVRKSLCFGSFNFDMVARVERFPVPGESLVACGSMTSAGGKGANCATAALKAGANVHYIGKIGNDTFGHFARRHLKSVGFNAVTLLVAEDVPTGNALIYVAGNDAENMIAVDPGANMTVTDDEIAGCIPAISCADVVLVQLENNLSAIEQVVDAAKAAGASWCSIPPPAAR